MFSDAFQLYWQYSIENIHDANVEIDRDTQALADAATQHSLMLNPKTSKILIFGNKSGIE